jgi:chromosome transmission fidelity protein 1
MAQTHQFRDTTLATLPDIEDLYVTGKNLSVCPYYASRIAIPAAEIITLPYPLLLQKTARDALGIELDGNVVIIDEAHNIMDAVASVYAAEITLEQLKRCRQMLGVYVKKFGKKLKGENRVMVAQVARVVDGLSGWLQDASDLAADRGVVDSNALLKSKGVDQINLFTLIKYIQDSKLAYKIEGFAAHEEEKDGTSTHRSASTPVLHILLSFLISLTNLSSEGRIFFHKVPASNDEPAGDVKLSYLLLSPTHAFASIASTARAVILAGGTMSPFEDYVAHLFPDLSPAKITTLSCGHVIPSSQLCVQTLASPRPGIEFEFSFQKRGDKAMIRELGLCILNICGIVPDGIVVFFPSYGYLDEVVSTWSTPIATQPGQESIWARLQAKKMVLRETKGGSSDEILATYSEAILGKAGSTGALLLSVVGGKMSEGINFSDRLGRCVIVVGLPYPNINSPDWKARLEYIESTMTARLRARTVGEADVKLQAKQAARDFYENACMRAVNQSIGRAIRHKADYAAIVLVDKRFGSVRIKSKLPGWIQGAIARDNERTNLGQLMGGLGRFFREKRGT